MKFTTKELCLTALFTALVFVMTFVPKIPIPLGYAHLGNAAVFLSVIMLDRHKGAVAGSLGSALADLIGGFTIWILPTLVIKYVMAMIFASCCGKTDHSGIAVNGKTLAALFGACLWMVIAYTLAGAALYGSLAAGLASLPGLAMEGLMNAVVFLALAKPLQKIRL
ncbi:MAG: ECF transporter S component [Anaerovibrio sp.]|nr:ECF transporter S component [Anaerovibrio sp.]